MAEDREALPGWPGGSHAGAVGAPGSGWAPAAEAPAAGARLAERPARRTPAPGGAEALRGDGPGPLRGDEPEAVLAALDEEQRQVALAIRGPVCVLAGAGTGKTRAIAHRIAYAVRTGAVNPGHVLAVTFTTRAAGELRSRLGQLAGPVGAGMERVTARTFHAAALRQLSYFWPRTVGGAAPSVLDSKISLLAEAARRVRVKAVGPQLRDVATEIEWAKVTGVLPDDYPAAAAKAGRVPPLDPAATARLFTAYEALRRERHLVDFESVLELTAAILAEHPTAAEQVRDRYRHFVVDEYQDVNPLQKLLLDTWLGGGDEICVVGDPRQTIYSFTGATPAYLTGFTTEFPHATVVRLVRNYRSTPQVVALANRLTSAVGAEGGRCARQAAGGGTAPYAGLALVAQRAPGPDAEFAEYADDLAEAAAVAARARALADAGAPPRQMAILVRTNAQTERFEAALAQAGLAFQVKGTQRFFDRPEVRQAMGLLRAAARSSLRRGERSAGAEPGGAGRPAAAGSISGGDPQADPIVEVRDVLAGLGLSSEPPRGGGAARDRWESLAALAGLAEDVLAAAPGTALPDVVAELTRRAALDHDVAGGGVTVASLHAAKGLEWDVVFLPGLTEGAMPIVHAQTEEEVEEERRLFYVGVTRARERILLSCALSRSPGGRPTRKPSRFLDPIRPGLPGFRARGRGEADAARGRGAGRRRGAASGSAPEAPADDPFFERLREWRRGAAREQGVPAYVVFPDETLRQIAARRPATIEEFSRIPGVGPVKLDRYGAAVLDLCGSALGGGAGPGAGGGAMAKPGETGGGATGRAT